MSDTCTHNEGGAYWVYDARGIPLAKVCGRCRAAKLAKYRPEVLTDPGYASDEPIDPEPGVGGYDEPF